MKRVEAEKTKILICDTLGVNKLVYHGAHQAVRTLYEMGPTRVCDIDRLQLPGLARKRLAVGASPFEDRSQVQWGNAQGHSGTGRRQNFVQTFRQTSVGTSDLTVLRIRDPPQTGVDPLVSPISWSSKSFVVRARGASLQCAASRFAKWCCRWCNPLPEQYSHERHDTGVGSNRQDEPSTLQRAASCERFVYVLEAGRRPVPTWIPLVDGECRPVGCPI